MKKLIISIIAIAFSLGAIAQSSSLPRFGTLKNQDNTGRAFTYGYIKPTVTATSLNIAAPALNYNYTLINMSTLPSTLGTLTVALTGSTRGYVGDEIKIVGYMLTTTSIVYKPSVASSLTGFVTGAVQTVTAAGKQFNISFEYDGTNYIETGRFSK